MDSDLSGKLNEILADPEKLKSVMSAVTGVMSGGEKPPIPEVQKPKAQTVLQPVASNERTELLRALKPFLSQEKCDRIDKIMRIMTFAELAGVLSQDTPKK